ncbi:unnamed protein product [Somion occarium]|uniref:Uncharacterized protein n=1 Tax=Somion occarium TaxID=3059160 RepID=A0ABP1E657_9APHY
MFAQYSPLFTSGLLSDSPSASRAPSPQHPVRKNTHDSLPLTVNTRMSDIYAGVESARNPQDNDGALFLTFRPHRKQVDEGLSFLSLDLAESQSMRSMSLRRKDTVTTKATTAFGRSEPSSPSYNLPVSPIVKRSQFAPQLPPLAPIISPISPVPTLRKASRETLRLPSPKPVPSSTLPEPPASAPAHVQRQRRPSNLTLTLSDCFVEAGPSSTSSSPLMSFHRPSYSAPSIFSHLSPLRSSPILSPDEERSYFTFSPTSPITSSFFPSSPPPSASTQVTASPSSPSLKAPEHEQPSAPVNAPVSLKASLSMRSTATINTRQRNRSAALDALEGRGRRKRRVRPNNFMSMSDDEDDDVAVDEESLIRDVQKKLLWVLNEEEDVVLPKSEISSKRASMVKPDSTSAKTSSSSSKRSRRSTIESFFSPLNNFIDFKDDDRSSLSWRSFVEFSA